MKKTCLFLFALLCVCAMFTAGALNCFGKTQLEIAPPEDGNRCHLTVFGEVPVTVDILRSWRPDCHVRQFRHDDPLAATYSPHVGKFPAIVYQSPDGTVLAKVSGAQLPRSVDGWESMVKQQFRPFRCPVPQPQPAPAPVAPAAIPDLVVPVPDVPMEEPEAPIWIYFVLGGLAAGASLGIQILNEMKGEKS
jgi:hypothetical protein